MGMKILTGDTRSKRNLDVIRSNGWGRMFTAARPSPMQFEPWGFDNGAFGCWLRGKPFDTETFQKRLEIALRCGSDPILAVAPDIVAGGLASLEFSVAWVMRLPSDWPWYLAVQDGMEVAEVHAALHLFTGIFLGGTDKFKLQAYRWCELAHANGKKFHYGRAGTRRKVLHAFAIGADSLDSSFPLWTTERFCIFRQWIDGIGTQRQMEWPE